MPDQEAQQQVDPKRKVYDTLSKDSKYKNAVPDTYEKFLEGMQDDAVSKNVFDALSKDSKYNKAIPSIDIWNDTFKKKDQTTSEDSSTGAQDVSEDFVSSRPDQTEEISANPLENQPLRELKEKPLQEELAEGVVQPEAPEFDLNTIEGILVSKQKELQTRAGEAQQNLFDNYQSEVDAGNMTVEEAEKQMQESFIQASDSIYDVISKEVDEGVAGLATREDDQFKRELTTNAADASSRASNRRMTQKELDEGARIVEQNKDKIQVYNTLANEALAKLPEREVKPEDIEAKGRGTSTIKSEVSAKNRQVTIARDMLQEIADITSKGEASEVSKFMSGLGEQGIDLIPFVGALSQIPDLLEQKGVLDKPQDQRTESEQMMVEAISMYNDFQRSGVKPKSYEWGEMLGQMIPYIGEFALTGGAASSAAKATGKALLKSGVKRGAVNYTLRGTAGAFAQATANPQRYVAETIKRMTPEEQMVVNIEDGKLQEIITTKDDPTLRTEGEGLGEASGKAYLSTVAEMLTERLGFAYGAGASRFAKSKVAKALMSEETLAKKTLAEFAKRKGVKSVDALDELVKKTGFNGVVAEVWGEELPNMALNELITGDQGISLIESLDPLNKDLLNMVVPTLVLQGAIYTPKMTKKVLETGAKAVSKKIEKKEEARLEKLFGKPKTITPKKEEKVNLSKAKKAVSKPETKKVDSGKEIDETLEKEFEEIREEAKPPKTSEKISQTGKKEAGLLNVSESAANVSHSVTGVSDVIRTEISEPQVIDGAKYSKMKIFLEKDKAITSIYVTPRGKAFSIGKDGKPVPITENKRIMANEELLTAIKTKFAPSVQESGNEGRAYQDHKGKKTTYVAEKDNRKGQEVFAKNHPIQIGESGRDGYAWLETDKLSKSLAKLQAKGKIFGKILFTRNPNKRRRTSLGNYTPSTGRIAVKTPNDIPTIIHEVGHAMDDHYDLLGTLSFPEKQGEEEAISYRASKDLLELSQWGSTPPAELSPEQANEYRMGEGLAEFFKSMVFNPEMTRNKFPSATKLIWDNRMIDKHKSHFNKFSEQIRAWAASNAKNKMASQFEEIKEFSRFENWKKKWKDVAEFYFSSADNWNAEAMEAFSDFKLITGVSKLVKPITTAVSNTFAGINRSFERQFLTRAFAFEMAVKYMNNAKGTKQLPENDPNILARLLYGMHEKFDDMLEDGLKDERGRPVLDKGEKMTKAWLIGAFDNSTTANINHGMLRTMELMVAERIVERFKNAVKTEISEKLEAYKNLLVDKNNLEDTTIEKDKEGAFTIDTKLKDDLLNETSQTKEEAEEIITALSSKIDSQIEGSKADLKSSLKAARKKYGDKIVAGVGAGVFRDLDVAIDRIAEHRADMQTNRPMAKVYVESARRYRKYADTLLKYMVAKGRMSKDQYNKIKEFNEYYIAMQRVDEIGVDKKLDVYKSTTVGKVGSASNPIKAFKGSGKTIRNPYGSLINNAYLMTKEADRNEVLQSFVEPLSTDRGMREGKVFDFTSIAVEVGESGKLTLPVYIEGEEKFYRFEEDIFQYLTGLGETVYRLPWMLTALPRLLRFTVTNAVPFAIKNRMRDFQSRLILSETSSILERPAEFWNKDKREFTKSMLRRYGGGQAGLLRDPTAYFRHEDIYYGVMDEAIQEASKKKISVVHPKNWGKTYTSYKKLLDRGEQATRLQEFQSVFKKAKSEGMDNYNAGLMASYEARDLLDFAVSGEMMSSINQVLPFTNAAVQGLRRAAKSIKKNPEEFAARVNMYSVIPAAAIRMINYTLGDDDEYLQQPAYLRDMFYLFKIGDQWIGIPKPFELGLGASFIERSMTKMLYEGRRDDEAFEGFNDQAIKALFPFDETNISSIGGFGSFTEAASNYVPFRDSNIISPYENGKNIGLRNTESASKVGKAIAEVTGFVAGEKHDPRKIDHIITSTTSYFGSALVNMTKENSDLYPELTLETAKKFGLALSGIAKRDPVFSAMDVKWVLTESVKYDIRDSQLSELKDFRELLEQYHIVKEDKVKRNIGKAIRGMATAIKQQIKFGGVREEKLLKANIKKREKGVTPDTKMKDLKKFIKD